MAIATLKRARESEARESVDLAHSLMLLSQSQQQSNKAVAEFECKTCSRKFSSFQALGGHRASHKKPRPQGEEEKAPSKPKLHECSICGMEFSLGQALGGHMRKHRNKGEAVNNDHQHNNNNNNNNNNLNLVVQNVAVLQRSNSKRVLCLDLDLNLTPLENDLKLLFGNKAPTVDLSLFS